MNKKRILLFTLIYTAILLLIIFNPFTKAEKAEGLLLDIIKESAAEDTPFVEESLIYGTSYKDEEDPEAIQHILLTEEEIRELLNILSSTEVKEMEVLKIADFVELWDGNEAETYSVDLTNRGYTMPYDVELKFVMRPYDEGKLLIRERANGGHYLTEDFRVFDKLKEFYAVPRENE